MMSFLQRFLSKKIVVISIVLIVVVMIISRFSCRSGDNISSGKNIFEVQQGELQIKVVESGTIQASNAATVKCEVEGQTTIISIVPEGSIITEQDVEQGKIIVELDSSQLIEKYTQQEITFNSASANYSEAKESLEIQKNQNDSDIQQGMLNVKFALMDFQKYLSEDPVSAIINQYKDNNEQGAAPVSLVVDPNCVGGEALQRFRELEADIDLKDEELKKAVNQLEWTEKLFEKKYVAGTELEADRLAAKRLGVQLDQAKTSLDLFRRYEFPKQVEKLFSDYREADRELDRIKARARSTQAQSEAKLCSQEANYKLQKDQLEKLKRQIDACTIRATVPGMVVYASSQNSRWSSSRTTIEEGAIVRERQEILTIPDAARMSLLVRVHETSVDMVKVGQPVTIFVDAFPDKVFRGKVVKIAPLPDPQNWLANPDLKVYSTEIVISGEYDYLRPGMNARAEIFVDEVSNAVYVPLQAVGTVNNNKVCYLDSGDVPQMVVVKTGVHNNSFVEIIEGLKKGDRILLNPPKYHVKAAQQAKESLKQKAPDENQASGDTDSDRKRGGKK